MELIGIIFSAVVLIIITPIMVALITSKEKQIKQRRERKIIQEQEYIQQKKWEKEALIKNENDIKRELQKKDSIKTNLQKSHSLLMAGIYSTEEYRKEKTKIIEKVSNIVIDNPEDFLLELLPLKENGVL
ncbi:MAG: hypothetical protein ACE5ES_04200, partial [Candidatus Nanoarchaeia archaeon]